MRRSHAQDRARGYGPALGALAVILALGAAACAGSSTTTATATATVPPSASSSPSASQRSIWLAGFGVAPSPEGLESATAELSGVLGDALVVAPVACFESLPAVAGSGYLLGAVADSKAAVQAIAAAAEVPVLFLAPTRTVCTD